AHRKSPVNRETRYHSARTLWNFESYFAQSSFQLFKPRARSRTHAQNRRAGKSRACDQLFRFTANEEEQLFGNHVCLRNNDKHVTNVKKAADVKVLARLRHHAFVSRNDERYKINSVRASEHVLDEALVAGNVYEAKR